MMHVNVDTSVPSGFVSNYSNQQIVTNLLHPHHLRSRVYNKFNLHQNMHTSNEPIHFHFTFFNMDNLVAFTASCFGSF